MRRIKKIVSLLGAAVLSLSACVFPVGCAPAVTDKEYADAESFLWGAYTTPPPAGIYEGNETYQTLEHFQNIKDCGFTHGISIYENNFETVRTALDLSEQAGLKYYPMYNGLSYIINSSEQQHDLTEDEKAGLKEFVEEFSDHPAFAGIYAVDEPKKDRWYNLSQAEEYVHSLPGMEDIDFMVSHHAPHADPAACGATEPKNRDLYTSYLETFDPPYLLYDAYPLMYDPAGNPILNNNWLDNAQTMAEIGKEYDVPIYYFMLTLGHLNYRTPDNYRDIAWQNNLSLAYGVRGCLVFTYWTPMADNSTYTYGLVDREGNKTPVWYAVQQVIEEYEPFNDVYMSFEREGTMLTKADEWDFNAGFDAVTNQLRSHPRIAEITCTQDTVTGTFKDADGRDAFMVVNYSDPYYAESDTVRIEFNDVEYVSTWRKGVQRVVRLNGGVYETTLGSGEGEFIIPLQ